MKLNVIEINYLTTYYLSLYGWFNLYGIAFEMCVANESSERTINLKNREIIIFVIIHGKSRQMSGIERNLENIEIIWRGISVESQRGSEESLNSFEDSRRIRRTVPLVGPIFQFNRSIIIELPIMFTKISLNSKLQNEFFCSFSIREFH